MKIINIDLVSMKVKNHTTCGDLASLNKHKMRELTTPKVPNTLRGKRCLHGHAGLAGCRARQRHWSQCGDVGARVQDPGQHPCPRGAILGYMSLCYLK